MLPPSKNCIKVFRIGSREVIDYDGKLPKEEPELCGICHEGLVGPSLVTCDKGHSLHYSCHRRWKEQSGNDRCIFHCGTNYKSKAQAYFHVLLECYRNGVFEYAEDILDNKLGRDLHEEVFRQLLGLPEALYHFLEHAEPEIPASFWDDEEHLAAAKRYISSGIYDYKTIKNYLNCLRRLGLDIAKLSLKEITLRHDTLHLFRYLVKPKHLGLNLEDLFGRADNCALYNLLRARCYQIADYLLDRDYKYINAINERGRFLLHAVVVAQIPMQAKERLVRKLAEKGVPLDIYDNYGNSAIDLAYGNHEDDVVALLHQFGAQVSPGCVRIAIAPRIMRQ